jgi:hypothetical protein
MVFIELGDGPGDSVINLQLVTRLEYSDDDGALVVHFVGGTTVSLGATQGVWLCRQISDLARTGRLMAMWAPPVAHGGGNANVRTDPHNPVSPQAPRDSPLHRMAKRRQPTPAPAAPRESASPAVAPPPWARRSPEGGRGVVGCWCWPSSRSGSSAWSAWA